MAQTGFTPIQLYSTSTAAAVPLAANLTNSTLGSELAINITDGKLFYKDNVNAVQVIGWKTVPATAGGTGQTSYAVGDLLYANSTTTLAKLADVATGNALISGGVGVAPSYGKIGLTTHISGTLAVGNGGTGITTTPTNGQIPIGNGTNYTAATLTQGTNIAITNSSGAVTIATSIPVPQITTYTSGSGTYTVPANTKYLQVIMLGGGGGGAGSGSGGGSGGSGGSTTFGTATSAGGSGGSTNGSVGGAGGAATVGSISGVAISGATGDGGVTTSVVSTYPKGGAGGASAFGGAGAGSGGSSAGNGGDGPANTGGGGGGAGGSATATFGGSGGGAGAYIDGLITSPSATYSYGVGAGGTAGTAGASGNAGGAGGSGYIMVVAYF